MSTIQTINNELPSTARPKINANFTALNNDKAEASSVNAALALKSNTSHTHTAADVGLGSVQNYGIASQAEAEVGSATNKYMTPQRTAQAISELAPGGSTKEFFVPAVYRFNGSSVITPYDNDEGHFPSAKLGINEGVRFVFFAPADFISLTSAKIVIIPDAIETIDYDVYVNYAAVGEAYSVHNSNVTVQLLPVTNTIITEINIAARFADLAANDYVGVNFQSNTDHIHVVGLRIKYA